VTTALSIANRTAFGQRVFVRDCQVGSSKPKAHAMRMSMTMRMAGRMHKPRSRDRGTRMQAWDRSSVPLGYAASVWTTDAATGFRSYGRLMT